MFRLLGTFCLYFKPTSRYACSPERRKPSILPKRNSVKSLPIREIRQSSIAHIVLPGSPQTHRIKSKMALRSLDNTLEMASERPRKAIKTSVSARITPGSFDCPKDETSLSKSGASSMDASFVPEDPVEYMDSKDLKPLAGPDANAETLLERLESKDWSKVCVALNDARSLAIHNSHSISHILDTLTVQLVKAMKSPRSALCKTSIMAAADFFRAFGDRMFAPPTSTATGSLLLQLLLKASQDKRFVCDEAELTLKAMVKSTPAITLMKRLQPCVNHSNMRVRAKAGVAISNCLSKMDVEEIKEIGFVPLLQTAVDLLNDRLPEARDSARSIIMLTYTAFIKSRELTEEEETLSLEDSWKSFCSSNFATKAVQALEKVIPH